MKISCPQCSQRIAISEEIRQSLVGQADFACPACGAACPTTLLHPEDSLGGLAADQLLMRGANTPQFSGPWRWEPPAPEELAKLLDTRYEIFRILGRGGMGAVYQARDNRLGRLVAIKILPQALVAEPGALERFEREARALAALDHPHIVKIHDYGQAADGSPFIIMEFVRGRDIQSLREAGELDLPNALRLISETCSALHYAHLKGIVHRDIKPANILVGEDGSAKVADFGLAKVESTHSRPMPDNSLTITGQVMGTPTYMAPEQEAGEEADHRADIYALGVTLYNLLTGAPPRGAWSLPSHKLQIDVRLDEIVIKALQEKPEARYQAAQDLKVDLDSVRTQTGGSALPPGVAPDPLPSSVGGVRPSSHHSRTPARVKLTVPAEGQPDPNEILATTRSLNNTMLILGLLAIGVIGGLAIFLANRKTGDTYQTQTSISTSVTNNTFFTQIIAAGLATSADLAAIADIRPRGETLIGISKEPLAWNEARDLAAKIGATVLPIGNASGEVDESLLTWVRENFASHLTSPVWVSSDDKQHLCDATEIAPAADLAAPHRVMLVWKLPKAPHTGEQSMHDKSVDLIALIDPERDKENGVWRKIPEGLLLESGQGVCRVNPPYVPPAEYDYLLEFSLVREWIGHVSQGCVKDGQHVGWTVQHVHGPDVSSLLWIDNVLSSSYPGTKAAQKMLKKNVKYQSLIEVRRDEVRAFLNGQMLASWKGAFRAGPSTKPDQPLSFGAWDAGIIFHKAEIIPRRTLGESTDNTQVSLDFTNSLGMKFVPVPGTKVMICIHETRRQDYALYAKEVPNVDDYWKAVRHEGVPCGDKDNHPVVGVNWFDARDFCAWLSKKEGKTYRLPTDQEWSFAVGLGQDEKWGPTTSPATVVKNTTQYPWGTEWPQPENCGNYHDVSLNEKAPQREAKYLGNYADGFPTTAPVMSFKPNSLGIYDLGGNLWEWCEDWYDGEKYGLRVLRGASWLDTETWAGYPGALLSSFRARHTPDIRYSFHGFRVVLELDKGELPPPQGPRLLGDPPNTTRRRIDLIQVASQQSVSHAESWVVKGEELELTKNGAVEFPHACGTLEYDLEFEFSILTEPVNSVGHSFPTPEGRCALVMQLFREHPGPFWGFGILDNVHYAFATEARVLEDFPPLFTTGKRYQTTVKVRERALEGFLDGRLLVHWEGDLSRFTAEDRTLVHQRHPKFGVHEGSAMIHKATLIEFVPKTP